MLTQPIYSDGVEAQVDEASVEHGAVIKLTSLPSDPGKDRLLMPTSGTQVPLLRDVNSSDRSPRHPGTPLPQGHQMHSAGSRAWVGMCCEFHVPQEHGYPKDNT